MAILGFHHTAISSPNLDRLVDFYGRCFGLERVFEFEWPAGIAMFDRMLEVEDSAARVVMLRGGNAFLEIFQFASPSPRAQASSWRVVDHGLTHICFAVDDARAECARLEALGVRLHCPVIQSDLPVCGTYARDPDGNVIEILEVREAQHPLDFGQLRLRQLQQIAARAGA